MAPAQVALHLGAAQIEIAVLEADFLGGRVAVGNLERQRRRRIQDLEFTGQYFYFAGRKFRVDGALGAAHDLALDRNVKLGTRLAGGRVGGGIVLGIQYQLDDSVAVAKIDEDKPAMIAPGLDPSPQRDLAADVGGPNRAAVIGSRPRRQRRILLSFRHCPSQLNTGCRRRIPVPGGARNRHSPRASAIARAASATATSRCVLCFKLRTCTTPRASSSSPIITAKRAPIFDARASSVFILRSGESISTFKFASRRLRATTIAWRVAAGPIAIIAASGAAVGAKPAACRASAIRSTPIAKPIPATPAPPIVSTSPSYRPPATTVLCAPRPPAVTSNAVRV